MHHYVTTIIIYFLIVFFMYVILVRETIIEGRSWQARARDKLRGAANSVGDAAREAADKAREAADKARAAAEEVARKAAAAAAALAAKLLDKALEKLMNGVTGIAVIFSSANQMLSKLDKDTSNISTSDAVRVQSNAAPAPAAAPAAANPSNPLKQLQIKNLLNEREKINQIMQMLQRGPKNAQTSAKAKDILNKMSQLNAKLNALK